jgi:CheY-like chemotaxis protein
MDLRMPQIDGIEPTEAIVARVPDSRVLVFSAYSVRALLQRGLESGARGYVLQEAPHETLVRRQRVCPLPASDGGDAAPIGDAGTTPRMWLWAKVAVESCVPLDDELADPKWLDRTGLVAGVVVHAHGGAESRVDDVTASYFYDDGR